MKKVLKILEQSEDMTILDELNKEELESLQKECIKKQKFYVNQKNYYLKRSIGYETNIRFKMKKIKEIESEIKKRTTIKKESKPKQIKKVEVSDEIREIQKIYKNENLKKEEKVEQFTQLINTYQMELKVLEVEVKALGIEAHNYHCLKEYHKYNEKKKEQKSLKNRQKIVKELVGLLQTFILLTEKKKINPKKKEKKEIKLKEDLKEISSIYYQILKELIKTDEYYYTIQQLLEQIKGIENSYIEYQKDEKKVKVPIIYEILDCYIYNTKIELLNQRKYHISKDYYFLLLKLFFSKNLDLSKEEQQFIDNRLEELKSFVKKYQKSSMIENQINELKNSNIETEISMVESPSISFLELEQKADEAPFHLEKEGLIKIGEKVREYELKYYETYGKMPKNKEISMNTGISGTYINSRYATDTITLEQGKYAYSISYDKDWNYYFKIHILDTSFIEEGSLFELEMKQNMILKNNKVNKDLKFRQNHRYPVMTYQLKINKNGKVTSFKVYESSIQIDKKYTNQELRNYRSLEELKPFLTCFHHLEIETIPFLSENIDSSIEKILNECLKEYIEDWDLPAIYYTEFQLNENEKQKILNDICYLLGKIPKKEAHQIFHIIENTKTSKCYQTIPSDFGNLEIDSRTYLGFYTHKLIKRTLKNPDSLEFYKLKYQDIFKTCEELFNQNGSYLDYLNKAALTKRK